MDLKFELDRLRFEMDNQLTRLREDLEAACGDLLATNAVLHAVVATHPDRDRLRAVLATFDRQASERAKAGSTKYRHAYAGAMSGFEWTMKDADANVPG